MTPAVRARAAHLAVVVRELEAPLGVPKVEGPGRDAAVAACSRKVVSLEGESNSDLAVAQTTGTQNGTLVSGKHGPKPA